MYTIGQTNPLTESDIQNIELLTPIPLPLDYKQFLKSYGFGSINEILMITQPDEQYIKLNFGDYLDLWNLTEIEKEETLNGLTIATTIDGDIIIVVNSKENPIKLLPRHSKNPLHFDNFQQVIDHYDNQYQFLNDLYFDTYYNYEQENISFIRNGILNKALFKIIYQNILNIVSYEKVYNLESQPKYIIQKIGGWIYFDNISKSSIRIKFQRQLKSEADKIIEYINTEIDKYDG
ncbi:SMI1/KNR4 family protein [Epilithonimonas lactis]|uniref:Knr4/Smi1-like domain-containing protein n=1 Tax=Epilithonimonas lactis TaxID=421072 RepID=A0A085B8X4_9FLAO|nr:SMI1/KNR4 family protein [Epilithonimonas lactis]KFC18919.1 hypothetical protein IO89_15425 [Epilithonimonas lactis]